MRVRLLKAARINHKAGEIVEVSPDQATFLLSMGVAVVEPQQKETVTTKKTVQRNTKK